MPKMLVTSINHAKGISAKTSKPYDFTILTAYKNSPTKSEDFNGVKPIELFCEESILKDCPNLPAICQVEYELDAGYNGRPQMQATSCKFLKAIDFI